MKVIGTGPADTGIFLLCIHLIPPKFQQVGIYDHAFHILYTHLLWEANHNSIAVGHR